MARGSIFFALVVVALAAGLTSGNSVHPSDERDLALHHQKYAAHQKGSYGLRNGPRSRYDRSLRSWHPHDRDMSESAEAEHDDHVEDDIRDIRIIIIVIIVLLVVVVILVMVIVGLMYLLNRTAARLACRPHSSHQ